MKVKKDVRMYVDFEKAKERMKQLNRPSLRNYVETLVIEDIKLLSEDGHTSTQKRP